MNSKTAPDLILHNGRITTLDAKCPEAANFAAKDGRIIGVDDAEDYGRGPNTRVLDLKGRRVIPGLPPPVVSWVQPIAREVVEWDEYMRRLILASQATIRWSTDDWGSTSTKPALPKRAD